MAGFDAFVCQTGGGTATLYAHRKGKPLHDYSGEGPDYYDLCAGPGWFNSPANTDARAAVGPDTLFCYGDDCADAPTEIITEGDEDTIAALFVKFIKEHHC